MNKQNSLQLAIDLATRRRDEERAQLQRVLQAQAFAQGQMDQLQQYATETDQRFLQGAQVSTSPELLQHQYQFMARLMQAITLQEAVLAQHSQREASARQNLIAAEHKLASFKHLLATRQAEQRLARERREQKQMDEFASQQYQRQRRLNTENAA